ncbi:MAG: saccharopine dehydrogenase NADP-binding domain-containing protein [Candidatus Nanopelagicales bacterium]
MGARIVVFGATGYTGEQTARELVARGARPALAGRSADRLERLAEELGGLETRVADVARPQSVTDLVEAGDVLLSTVGPFTQWGAPAVEAAIERRAWYLDSTGEPPFIRRVFEQYGARAEAAGTGLVTAFGFDWVPGNLAGAIALAAAGPEAVSIDIGYFTRGPGGISGGTRASMVRAALEPGFAHRAGQLRTERIGARVSEFTLDNGMRRVGVSVGGSEHFGLPPLHPTLLEVNVVLGQALPLIQGVPVATGLLCAAMRVPGVRPGVTALVQGKVKGSTGGPGEASRSRGGCSIVAEARAANGDLLQRVQLDGPNAYDFTFRILAWGAMTAAGHGLKGTGALGPVQAFGLAGLIEGAALAGLAQV